MAQDGGGVPSARVMGNQSTRPPSLRGPGSDGDVISLAQPRPILTRKQNEYIEAPLRPQLSGFRSSKSRLKYDQESATTAGQFEVPSSTTQSPAFPGIHRSVSKKGTVLHGIAHLPITAQPAVTFFKKEKLPDTLSNVSSDGTDDQHQDSIICRQCRRCKCEDCRSPRHLPSRWICNAKCLCSASSVVDYATCMCCVKGLFYHWGKDYESDNEVSCEDQPCSCSSHKRFLRWGCLGLLSFALPCLLCYWPLKGCVKMCESCYTKCTTQGCQCTPHHRTNLPIEQAPEKRLLDTNSDC